MLVVVIKLFYLLPRHSMAPAELFLDCLSAAYKVKYLVDVAPAMLTRFHRCTLTFTFIELQPVIALLTLNLSST